MNRTERIRVMRVITRMNVGGPALQASVLHARPGSGTLRPAPVHGARRAGRGRLPGPARRRTSVATGCRGSAARCARRTTRARSRPWSPRCAGSGRTSCTPTWPRPGSLGRTAAALARVPARVHTFHGHLLYGYFSPAKTRLVVAAERMSARRCDRLVAVGARVRDELVAAGVGRPRQYAVVPPGTVLGPPAGPRQRAYGARRARRGAGRRVRGPADPRQAARPAGGRRARAAPARARASAFVVCGSGDAAGEVTSRRELLRRRDARGRLALRRRDRVRRGRPGAAHLRQRGHAGLADRGRAGRASRSWRHVSAASARWSKTASPACSARATPASSPAVRRGCWRTRRCAGRWDCGHACRRRAGSGPNVSSPTWPGSTRPSPRNGAGGPGVREKERSPMRVLVTGGAGFIGANLCRELLARPQVDRGRRARRPQHRPRGEPRRHRGRAGTQASILDTDAAHAARGRAPTRSCTSPRAPRCRGRWPTRWPATTSTPPGPSASWRRAGARRRTWWRPPRRRSTARCRTAQARGPADPAAQPVRRRASSPPRRTRSRTGPASGCRCWRSVSSTCTARCSRPGTRTRRWSRRSSTRRCAGSRCSSTATATRPATSRSSGR